MDIETAFYKFKDMRTVTLKRWNLPQTERVFGDNYDRTAKLGDYISYSSHHFVDIRKVISVDGHPASLTNAYTQIADDRKNARNNNFDIHTVQSMTLIGPETTFWDKTAGQLFVTFVQLRSPCLNQFNKIQEQLQQLFDSYKCMDNSMHPEFALYYSLDFCDLALFVKNIHYYDLHDALWRITLIRPDNFVNVRDTFTICCFGWDYLKKCFLEFEKLPANKIPILWNDTLSISVNLSVQALSNWEKLKANLDMITDITIHRLTGRHDINFVADSISGTTVLRILYEIDKLCVSKTGETFGGYDIVLRANPWESEEVAQNPKLDERLFKAATSAMDQLCKENANYAIDSIAYLYETKNSLKELLKNGFADEFLLSVLPSYIGYLKIKLQCAMESTVFSKEKDSLDGMRRDYYTALNTLTLCTMHNERHFIQAPSFNALYFEIPPKLLAFYSAVGYDIASNLCNTDQGEKPYRFIIAPDYRQDIYVKPLQIAGDSDTNEHLAVIYLCEKYFYEPTKAIMLLAHEIGHFVGDRKRKERAQLIFKAVSLILLSNTYLSAILTAKDLSITAKDLLDIFADTLANYLMALAETSISKTRGIPYLLSDIQTFLESQDYGLYLFTNEFSRDEITELWRKRLFACLKNEEYSQSCHDQVLRGLSLLQESIGADYLTNCGTYCITESILDIFARQIASQLADLQYDAGEDIQGYFSSVGNDIIRSFSESYADLRMREIFGSKFKYSDYLMLIEEVDKKDTIVNGIRVKVMCHILKQNVQQTISDNRDFHQKLLTAIIDHILQYLSICSDLNVGSRQAQEAYEAFHKMDLFAQCNIIDRSISNYRETVVGVCEDITKNDRIPKTDHR